MKVNVDLKLKKLFLNVADIKGKLEINLIAEDLTNNYAKNKIIDTFKNNGFKGKVIIDGNFFLID